MLFTNIKFFMKNIWRFRKLLWEYRQWDYPDGFLEFNKIALSGVRECIEDDRIIKRVDTCLHLTNRIQNAVSVDFYATYEVVEVGMDNGNRITKLRMTRNDGVPKSACAFKQERNDWNYLYHLLSKHSQNFYD